MTTRPHGPGLHMTIHLGRTRKDDLRATHRDRDNLPAIADPERTAKAILTRATRDFGPAPRQALQKMLAASMGKS